MSTMPTSSTPTVLETVPEISPPLPHNGREARNLAEKHRRDKLNSSIQELATMVPHVADSTRRMDKTAVLRFAAHGLRLQYVFGKTTAHDNDPNMRQQLQPQLTDALMQLLDAFFITMTCHGQIVLISSSVEQLLGHCQSDLYGQNILHIVHPEDQALLLQQLIPRNMEALFRNNDDGTVLGHQDNDDELIESLEDELDLAPALHSLRCNNNRKRSSTEHYADIDKNLREDRRCFTVRLARAGTRSETTRKYEIVMIDGLFRRSDCSSSAGSFPIVSQLIRRSRNGSGHSSGVSGVTGCASNMSQWIQHDAAIAQAALHGISGNDIVLVAMARVIRPPKVIGRFIEANNLEYRTRHLIDGRIIDCDQRIGLVAGYMQEEVRNLCPFTFMHQDDVRWVIVALRQMYDCNNDYGESCYRLLSRNGHFIYLQSKGYLEIDKSTNKVHSFVCVNTLLDEEEGKLKVQEMKKKFSIIINAKIPSSSLENLPASQNPQQLERIVLYLIENLQKRNDSFESITTTPAYTQKRLNSSSSQGSEDSAPLALVPPEPDSVKSSISKSVNIVNVTAARNLQYNQKSPASYQSSEISLSPTSSIDHCDDLCGEHMTSITPPPVSLPPSLQRPSVLVQTKTLPVQLEQPSVFKNTAKPTTILKDKVTECKVNSSASATEQSQSRPQNISVLKRMPPPSNPCPEECISPAKRSPRSFGNVPNVVLDPLQTFDNTTKSNEKLFENYTCNTTTTLEHQFHSSKSKLLNNNMKMEKSDKPVD